MSDSEDARALVALRRALDRLRDRNETPHTYNEAVARRIYASVRAAYPEMERTCRFFEDRFPA